MNMNVADPAAFVDHENSKPAMEKAIATVADVLESAVTATLSVGGSSRLRRLQAGTVIVDADIEVEDATAGAALVTTLDAVTPEAFTNATLDALEELDVDTSDLGLEVTGVTSEYVAPPTEAPSSGNSGLAGGSGAIGSCKVSSLAPLLAVSAWLLAHA